MMDAVIPWDEARKELTRARTEEGFVISTGAARAWAQHKREWPLGSPLAALAAFDGFPNFDPRDVVGQLDGLLTHPDWQGTGAIAEFAAVKAWAEQQRVITIYTRTMTEAEHAAEVHEDSQVETYYAWVEDLRDDLGGWVSPGEANYPADPENYQQSKQHDGDVWLPASVVETAGQVLTGDAGPSDRFYASEASSYPWHPGSWYSAECDERIDRDEVIEKSAHLHGFTEGEEAAIYRLALPRWALREDVREATRLMAEGSGAR